MCECTQKPQAVPTATPTDIWEGTVAMDATGQYFSGYFVRAECACAAETKIRMLFRHDHPDFARKPHHVYDFHSHKSDRNRPRRVVLREPVAVPA